jgi:energy-coupling factor transporter ATP-binding protein EcfA2
MSQSEQDRKNSRVRAKEIEDYLSKERKEYLKYKSEPKLLILGSSDSGKSTLLKQLKILHGNGFTEQEKELSRKGIMANIIAASALLLSICEGPFAEEKKEVRLHNDRSINPFLCCMRIGHHAMGKCPWKSFL